MKRLVALVLAFTLITSQAAYAAPHIIIKAGTEVLLKNIDKLSSKTLKEGQVVQFLAEKSIKDKNGNVLIEQGAMAYGTIAKSESAGMVGAAGKLGLQFNSVKAFNDIDIPLTGNNESAGHSNTGAAAGAALIGTFVIFWPLAPAALFFRGSNAVIQSGTIMRAYVAKDTVLVPGDEEAAQEAAEEEYAKTSGFSDGNKKLNSKLNEMLKAYDAKEEAENSFVPPTQQTQPAENAPQQNTTPADGATTGE